MIIFANPKNIKLVALLFILLIFGDLNAQYFELSLHDTMVYGDPDPIQSMIADGYIRNISASNLHIKMIRLQNNLPNSSWFSSLCLGLTCGAPLVDSISTTDPIAPGDSIFFDINFIPDTIPGTATVLVKFATIDDAQNETQLFTASTISNSIDAQNHQLAVKLQLFNNYPNPFNNRTVIGDYLPLSDRVELQIFDLLGRQLYSQVKYPVNTGYLQFFWNGKNNKGEELGSGIYFYRVIVHKGDRTSNSLVKKLTIIR